MKALLAAMRQLKACAVLAGGCSPPSQINPYYIANATSVCDSTDGPLPNLPTPGVAYECPTWKLNSGPLWMGLGCLAIMTILMSRSFKASQAKPSISICMPMMKMRSSKATLKSARPIMAMRQAHRSVASPNTAADSPATRK